MFFFFSQIPLLLTFCLREISVVCNLRFFQVRGWLHDHFYHLAKSNFKGKDAACGRTYSEELWAPFSAALETTLNPTLDLYCLHWSYHPTQFQTPHIFPILLFPPLWTGTLPLRPLNLQGNNPLFRTVNHI